MNSTTLLPAYLFEGEEHSLLEDVELFLQNNLCRKDDLSDKTHCFCNDCRLIKNNQHHAVVWLSPDGNYTNKDLDVIFHKIVFALEPQEHFFFVLPTAHLLTTTCANRLLKCVEEPPSGYHFLFLTDNAQGVLPTISSRCVLRDGHKLPANATIHTEQDANRRCRSIASFFLDSQQFDPVGFEKTLKAQPLSHTQTVKMMNTLVSQLTEQLHHHLVKLTIDSAAVTHIEFTLSYLAHRMKKMPQSGSSTLFLKSLYISYPQLNHSDAARPECSQSERIER